MSKTEARDFVMARLAAAGAMAAAATAQINDALALFCAPDDDKKGKERAELLEAIDDTLGDATRAVQAAQEVWPEVDPTEGEPEGDDDDDENADAGDDED